MIEFVAPFFCFEKLITMGKWHTVHLFDEKKFREIVIPKLRGLNGGVQDDFMNIYFFFPGHFPLYYSICKLSKEEQENSIKNEVNAIEEFSKSFDDTFKLHREFSKDSKIRELKVMPSNFMKLFEALVFKYCVDYFPFFASGKHGISSPSRFCWKSPSIGLELIRELDYGDYDNFNLFSDDFGIVNWITNEELSLIYDDKQKIRDDGNEAHIGFFNLVDMAYQNGLGLIQGVGMNEDLLQRLPQNKVASESQWNKENSTGLFFNL